MRKRSRSPRSFDRATAVAVRRVRTFGKRHAVDGDTTVRGAITHVGRGVTRLVLVGRDGALGDMVLRREGQAASVADLAGMTLLEPDARELGESMRTGPYVWRRMAGMQLGGGPR